MFIGVVRALAGIVTIIRLKAVAEIVECAELRAGFRPRAPAQIRRVGNHAKPVLLEQLGVRLLAEHRRLPAGAGGREQVGDPKFAGGGRFVAQVAPVRVAKLFVAVRQKQVRGIIRVIGTHGAAGLAQTQVGQTGVAIDAGKVRAAHGAVFVQQQLRAIDAAVVVQRLGFFEVANGVVDFVVPLVEQRGIQPRGRIFRVELFGERQLFAGVRVVAGGGVSFAEIAAKFGALRFQRGGDEQILAATGNIAEADAGEAATEPGVAERGIHGQCAVEPVAGGARFALRGEHKTFQRQRLRVARREREALIQGGERGGFSAKAEFQFCDARPREARLWRVGNGLPRKFQRVPQRNFADGA